MPNSCINCIHYHCEEYEVDGYTLDTWLKCDVRSTVANLKQFPFKNTECKSYSPNPKQIRYNNERMGRNSL